jgi:hypothetical protein
MASTAAPQTAEPRAWRAIDPIPETIDIDLKMTPPHYLSGHPAAEWWFIDA